jgi:hypothetical protein
MIDKKDADEYLQELASMQIKNISYDKRLNFSDLKRIAKYINGSIFSPDTCSLWKGYITNENNPIKGTYINFYFKNKKVALHRLLYINFIESLVDGHEYLKYSCENRGKCCNINHIKKYKYNKKKTDNSRLEINTVIVDTHEDLNNYVIDFN